ncbi:MAG: CHASE2 domain-containing protein [Kiritimatiellia bacterium]
MNTVKKIIQGLVVGVGAALIAGLIWSAGWLDVFEWKTWDWRVRLLARPGLATDRIRLILLDQASLDWGAERGLSWPWPREVYAPIVDFCRRQGACAVAFDVLFTEPSKYLVADDAALGAAAANAGNFVAAVFLGAESGSATNWPADMPPPYRQADIAVSSNGWPQGMVLPRATFPIPEIATNAAVLANVYANPDADGVYRRVRLGQVFDGRLVPALGLGAWLAADPEIHLAYENQALRCGDYRAPLDDAGYALLNFRGQSRTHRAFSAAAVIESALLAQEGQPGSLPADAFHNCYVFFGFSAPGLYDLRPTPVSGVYPGVEIHATMLDNLLSRDLMRDVPRRWTWLWLILMGGICGMAVRGGRNARDNLLAFVLTLPTPMLLSLWAYSRGFWLPLLPPTVAAALALIGGVLLNYAVEGRQKRYIRSAFRQYLSEDVIAQLVADPSKLTLGGEQRTLSIFFSDLQGFTGISEKLNPRELTSLLNEYLTAMTDIIQSEGGTVDKYEGDAIIAFWNAPLPLADHAVRAVRAALQCQARLAEMRPDLKTRYGSDLFMRIGLNTGPVVVGNMGSHNRFNYTILGDAANLAARLEGINKQFGSFTLISEATQAELLQAAEHGIAVRELGRVAVVGRREPVTVYEPVCLTDLDLSVRRHDWEIFSAALKDFYAGRFAEAQAQFMELQERDPPSAAYVRKCQALLDQPPAEWNGVWVMTEK